MPSTHRSGIPIIFRRKRRQCWRSLLGQLSVFQLSELREDAISILNVNHLGFLQYLKDTNRLRGARSILSQLLDSFFLFCDVPLPLRYMSVCGGQVTRQHRLVHDTSGGLLTGDRFFDLGRQNSMVLG